MKKRLSYSLYEHDQEYLRKGFKVVGLDEAGRGPLAGPVVAASCVLNLEKPIPQLNDSKQLTAKVREELYEQIVETCECWSCKIIDVETIDKMNILHAAMHGMYLATASIDVNNPVYLVDGNYPVKNIQPQVQIIKGDSISASIAAASIIAKVTRDRLMKELAVTYPDYGFETNFGYGCKKHLSALEEKGPTPIHRKSFAPVKRILERRSGYDLFQPYKD